MDLRIRHQPKQAILEDAILNGRATVIGYGGSRGGAKSGGIRRLAVELAHIKPGCKISIWMRNYDAQLKPNHIDQMLRDFPEFQKNYKITDKELHFPWCRGNTGGHSVIKFSYADTFDDLKKKTYGPEYQYILVDQAEQFTESEIQALRMCNRAPNTALGAAKMVLGFNPGGIGFGYLKRIFWDRDFREGENPDDYQFVQAFVWDNIEWSRQALVEDGFTEEDYYRKWTEKQRKDYTITRSQYGKVLAALPPELREPMLYGSMEIVSGQYFVPAMDRDKTLIPQGSAWQLIKPWWKRWMSGDWGSGHFTSYYWHARGKVEPREAKTVLGLDVLEPISVLITYREWIGQGMSESEIAEKLVSLSDAQELGKLNYSPVSGMPEKVRALYFSPDAFEMSIKRSGQNAIADELGKVLREGGLPYPTKANNARVAGWRSMYGLLSNTKRAYKGDYCGTVWLITDNCRELWKALPLAVRDEDNLEDVLKTDKNAAAIEMDALDGARYGILCREVTDNEETQEAKNQRVLDKCPTPNDKYLYSMMLPKGGAKKTFRW